MDKESKDEAYVKNLLFYAEGWKLLYGLKDVQIMLYTGVSRMSSESVEKADVIDVVIYKNTSLERYANLTRREESINTIEQKVSSLIASWDFVDEDVCRMEIASTVVLRIYRSWAKTKKVATKECLQELSTAICPLVYSKEEGIESGAIKGIKLSLLDENGNQADAESEDEACHVLFEVELNKNSGVGVNTMAGVKSIRQKLEDIMTEHDMMYTMPFIRIKDTFMCRIAHFRRL